MQVPRARGGSGDDLEPVDLMSLHGRVGEQGWAIAGRAVQLVEWARTHRFCGRARAHRGDAGGAGEAVSELRASGVPRLAPAMIALVERGDEVLLARRGVPFPLPMYSCLAGFVEPGETVEEAVSREVGKRSASTSATSATRRASRGRSPTR